MAIHSISSDTSTTIVANVAGDTWLVKAGVEVTTSGACINAEDLAGGKTFLIQGTLVSDANDGLALGIASSTGFNIVTVADTGFILADQYGIDSFGGHLTVWNQGTIQTESWGAIYAADGNNRIINDGMIASQGGNGISLLDSGNKLANAGTIIGDVTGVSVTGSVNAVNTGLIEGSIGVHTIGDYNVLSNAGTIIGSSRAVYTAGEGTYIENTGTIQALAIAGERCVVELASITTSAGYQTLANYGLIEGNSVAVRGSNDAQMLINRGDIRGHIDLRDGDDIFDGVGGEVFGEVRGGDGNDTYRVDGAAALVELADQGTDTVESTVSYRLAASFENLVLLGTDDTDATGNGAANVLTGNVGDNRLGGGTGNDQLFGGAGEDRLFGSAGADVLRGEDGEDMLLGGADQDILVGGADNDRFIFRLRTDSTVTASDRIADFTRGEDIVDLSAIDARVGGAVNNAFTFIGTAAFSGAAGELRFVAGTTSRLEADTDGNGIADFRILFTNGVNLQALDIIL